MSDLIVDRLRRRVRRHGAHPLLTYYDVPSGERTELSATTLLNWVDKTSNLFDDLGVRTGSAVELAVAREAPGHWQTLVLELGLWQLGAVVHVSPEPSAEVLVVGPDAALHDLGARSPVLACALHPLGLGFSTPLPPGMDDFALEVRGQPDVHLPGAVSADAPAWVDGATCRTQADLLVVEQATDPVRRLVEVSDAWTTVLQAIVLPVLTGGSTVLVRGGDPERLAHIAVTEKTAS